MQGNRTVTDPLSDYTSEHDLPAKVRQKTVRTIRAWRARGEGPPWVRIGRLIYYPNDGIEKWLRSLEQQPVRARSRAT
jgi:hypothetical protein